MTTHGGRTTSPIVEGDKVILNALVLAWGDLNRTGNRYFAFDKKTGQTVWISSPQARHYDTNYSTPIVADHRRHARADRRRHRRRVSRAQGQHRREDLVDRSQQARDPQQRAVPRQRRLHHARRREHGHHRDGHDRRASTRRKTGTLAADAFKWRTRGFLPTFASPVMDDERLYTVDNSAIVGAFDLKTGAKLWEKTLGTLQKGSPVLADGKLYVGTENGKFYILRPSATGVEVLDEDLLGTAAGAGSRSSRRRSSPTAAST